MGWGLPLSPRRSLPPGPLLDMVAALGTGMGMTTGLGMGTGTKAALGMGTRPGAVGRRGVGLRCGG